MQHRALWCEKKAISNMSFFAQKGIHRESMPKIAKKYRTLHYLVICKALLFTRYPIAQ